MANPEVKTTTQTYLTARYGAYQGGVEKYEQGSGHQHYHYSTEFRPDAEIIIGGKVQKKGSFAQAELGIGNGLSAGTSVGHEFDINKTFGLELSANAKGILSRGAQTEVHASTIELASIGGNADNGLYSRSIKHSNTFAKADTRAMLTFKKNAVNVKAGIEYGYSNNGMKAGTYTSPRIESSVNLGKNWSAQMDASAKEANIGIRYNLK